MGDDPETVKRGLRESLRRLLDEDFDALLFAHGEPMPEGGHDALRAFVG
jgi:glyoxylase-like metal-dependent hydrolase (beta-lactamase superfamily II)